MSHQGLETRSNDASHIYNEAQDTFASHHAGENQHTAASQHVHENQKVIASQFGFEAQSEDASQPPHETQILVASQHVRETQIPDASHPLDYEEDRRRRRKAWEERQRELFKRLKHPRLRILVEGYYDMQKLRISLENRLRIYNHFNLLTSVQVGTLQGVIDEIRQQEKTYERLIRGEIRGVPIYFNWMRSVKGVGPVMAAGLVAWIDDIARFPTVSKLWAYAVGKPRERRQHGERIGYNPHLKTHCWKVASQMIRAKGDYANLYYQFKNDYSKREDLKKIKEGSFKLHIHRMAMRKMVKLFLSHLWAKWREFEGLSVSEPYAIAILGHAEKIEPELK